MFSSLQLTERCLTNSCYFKKLSNRLFWMKKEYSHPISWTVLLYKPFLFSIPCQEFTPPTPHTIVLGSWKMRNPLQQTFYDKLFLWLTFPDFFAWWFTSLSVSRVHVQNGRDFPQTKLDREINFYYLNVNGKPYRGSKLTKALIKIFFLAAYSKKMLYFTLRFKTNIASPEVQPILQQVNMRGLDRKRTQK